MSYYIKFEEYPELYQKLRELYFQTRFSNETFSIWVKRKCGCYIDYETYIMESLIFSSEQDAFLFLVKHS